MPRKPVKSQVHGLIRILSKIKDPRVARTRLHPLVNVLTMSLFGVLGGAEGWEDLEDFSAENQDFFAEILDLRNGTPSADTFRRVFEALEPRAFQEAFFSWARPLLGNLKGTTIAVDGKTLRGALAHSREGKGLFHMLHVWATDYGILLGQQAVENAGQESAAAQELLSNLELEGTTVTADAAHCNVETTRAIRERKGHYVLALKRNQAKLHAAAAQHFAVALPAKYTEHLSQNTEHGRFESRTVRAMAIPKELAFTEASWHDLKSIVRVERVRVVGEKSSVNFAYYISSHAPKATLLATHIRDHWKIENQLHHVLDVNFAEDRRKIRSEHGAQNFALVCRFVLSLLKQDQTKISGARKKRRASWSHEYRLTLLTQGFPAD